MRKRKDKSIVSTARGRFEVFIAEQLDTKADVSKSELAEGFIETEAALVSRLQAYSLRSMLKRWAEDILKSATAQTADRPQMILPLGFSGVHLPAAFSFVSRADDIRHVASYKALGWQFHSHLEIERKHLEAVTAILRRNEELYEACVPLFETAPLLTLREALDILREREQGAA